MFDPAWRLTSPVKVNLLSSRFPKAEPAIGDIHEIVHQYFLETNWSQIKLCVPERCPLINTCIAWPVDWTKRVGCWPPCRNDSDELISILEK